MAESILNRLGAAGFKGYSAGSQPTGRINPYAIDTLKQNNYMTDELRSKDWVEFERPDSPKLDFVFTLCDSAAQETCPVWPGRPYGAHWGLPDPAAVKGTQAQINLAFAQAYGVLYNRISAFVNLPISSLDKQSLQHRIEEIGRLS